MKKNPSPRILLRTLAVMLILGTLGCAGTTGPAGSTSDMVEIPNPGLTMSPNAPETVWVPRSYLEKGVPRGKELVKEGYQALTGKTAAPKPVPANTEAAATPPPLPADTAAAAPIKPVPSHANSAAAIPLLPADTAATAPTPPVLRDTAGNPAGLIPRFGLVVAVDGERVYFNLGKEDGIAPGQALKVYRGGTVVEGLGLAPGETVGTLQVLGLVGSKGAYGVMKGGEPARASDLIGLE